MSLPANDSWSKLSLLVANDPDNFTNWENLVKFSYKGLSKVSPKSSLDLFRASNDQFLLKFPNLEHYWIKYALEEFKLGYTERTKQIFEKSLEAAPYSNTIWMSYLKVLKDIELNYEQILTYYRRAERTIGTHYHSYQFWKDFIELEVTHNGKSIFYFNLLKKVLCIPIFNYSYFFKIFFQEIDKLNQKTLTWLVTEQELKKKLKLESDQMFNRKDYHDIKSKLKKFFTDSYITTQYMVFEYYQFEKNIKLDFFVPGLIKSFQELANWDKYLSYMEISGTYEQTEQLYNRALISLQSYPQVWLRFADFYLSRNQISQAHQILSKSFLFLSKVDIVSIQVKLIRTEVLLNEYIRAKDLAEKILQDSQVSNSDLSYEILLELFKIENLMNRKGSESFIEYLLDLIQTHLPLDASLLVLESLLNNGIQIEGVFDFMRNVGKDIRFRENVKYWLIFLNSALHEIKERTQLLEIFHEATENFKDEDSLNYWHNNYLAYSNLNKEELKDNFKFSLK